LLGALREAVLARLAGYGAPEAALAAALEDLPKGTSGQPTLEAVEHCGLLVGEAFALPGADAAAFARRAAEAERRRRGERRAAARAARETRAEEERRLKAWEASLVGAEAVPGSLGCTREEAERWIRDGRVPVARRVEVRRGARTLREPEFDPAALEALRGSAQAWREVDGGGDDGPAAALHDEARTGARRTGNAAVARVAGLDRYAAHFATARALDRRIVACFGPTNSGKTFFGLARLAEAESGVALGPLRLLAHEYREALEARGVPTALSTGEERIAVPGSRHTAATVEMCPFRTPVDVAVVDEAQMLGDPERGAAWTAAIMGVPARTVIVLGAPDAAPMVRRIAALCGDPLEEVRLERMGPLVAAREPVPLDGVGRGDAVVAFSRREVFALRAALLRRGRGVAVVYGALGPTVRRAEASRFREGEAEVLVATDAIGMGLNIGPLRRVVFSALDKWDGERERPLSVAGDQADRRPRRALRRRARRGGGRGAGGGGDPARVAHALAAGPARRRTCARRWRRRRHRGRGGGRDRDGQPVRHPAAHRALGAAARRPELPPRRPVDADRRRRGGGRGAGAAAAGPLDLRALPGGRARRGRSRGWPTGRWSTRWAWRWRRRGPGGCPRPSGPARTRCNWRSGCTGAWWPGAGWRCASRAPTGTSRARSPKAPAQRVDRGGAGGAPVGPGVRGGRRRRGGRSGGGENPKGRSGPERAGAAPRHSGKGRRSGRRAGSAWHR
jgi:hypothetical protein